MRIYTLASGSGGNCTLVKDGADAILIDAGISLRRIKLSLAKLGMSFDDICGIFISHEHSDHVFGLKTLVKNIEIPIFAPRTVANRLRLTITGVEDYITVMQPLCEVKLGGLAVASFNTPHDTQESVGYRVSGSCAFGICTDCGHVSEEMLEGLKGVKAALIEANHDVDMLVAGSYPAFLKRRILSEKGHLSNESCAELAKTLVEGGATQLVLGHLSRENNSPSIAFDTVSNSLLRLGLDVHRDLCISVAPEKDLLGICLDEGEECAGEWEFV